MQSKFSAPRPCALATAVAVALSAPAAYAQKSIEEITVTATKREESLQDVPVAVTALTATALEEMGITNFSDYVLELPGVTAGGSGPGQNTVYIRGVASTTPNLTVAGVAGLSPNVAFYLDQQPLAQPGRNLDVYAADLQRIEVLSGPQGTLFGASSQAGNVRLITNKPDHGNLYGNIKVGAGTITEGDMSSNIEAMINIPVTDTFALRGVAYYDKKGGYIDNVAGTRDATESARFRPAGTVRDNGVEVSPQREGFQADADLGGVTFLEADNSDLVNKDFNETEYTGVRVSASWEINDAWRLLVSHQTQDVESDGVFFADPNLGDLEVQRFSPLVADRDEAVEIADDRHCRLQALAVVAVHRVQAPGRHDVWLDLVQGLFRAVRELEREFGVGRRGAARPFEHEVLPLARHAGKHRGQRVGMDEGELDLEVLVEAGDQAVVVAEDLDGELVADEAVLLRAALAGDEELLPGERAREDERARAVGEARRRWRFRVRAGSRR